ncbi:hypothetical protein H7S55_05420 [Priestia aryabhattai]|uniref:hypothetical protein n=1 Tax=Priestia aryabhattai TaxID=412384 RepID=UPI001C8F1400|nr:hypothetical protein [Priestia aryabhattai]MBX9999595.1 hypothetical protein [Priestia aryabhattai]
MEENREQWTEVINGKEVKVTTYTSEKTGITGTIYGEPDTMVWARKLMQVYRDMKAGRYDKEEG